MHPWHGPCSRLEAYITQGQGSLCRIVDRWIARGTTYGITIIETDELGARLGAIGYRAIEASKRGTRHASRVTRATLGLLL